MDHATIARSLIADYTGGEPDRQIAEAQVHALLNIGEAIDAQTQELRTVREQFSKPPTVLTPER